MVEDSCPGNDGGWRGGAEPHTCQMICHYRGVSTQLSPPNHPSYPLSHPPKLYSGPPKTPPAFLRQLRFHSQHCYPICPSFLHSTLRENVPCERHITVSALCRICVLMPQYVSYTIHVYVRAKRFVSIQTANQRRRILPAENMWIGPCCGSETKPPQTSQTQRTLTGILYLSTAVFHHHRS